jgi:hypothetical protein
MIPAGTVIHYRQPTYLEMYRTDAIIASAAFFLLTALVATLVLERRRRSAAELATQVETHGGRIWAQNCEASGAAFFVELPTPTGPAVSLSGAP